MPYDKTDLKNNSVIHFCNSINDIKWYRSQSLLPLIQYFWSLYVQNLHFLQLLHHFRYEMITIEMTFIVTDCHMKFNFININEH